MKRTPQARVSIADAGPYMQTWELGVYADDMLTVVDFTYQLDRCNQIVASVLSRVQTTATALTLDAVL